jgi:signal transduction histidine kinase
LEVLTSVVFTILLLVVLILVSQRFRLVNAQVILRDEARRALEEDHESLRVRVFDHLHGTVQSELLVTRIRLLDIAREIDDERVADAIMKEASNISRIHDLEIRRLAHVMVASGIDVSLAEALRQLALACEGLCDVRIDLSDDFAEFDLTLEGDKRATVRLAIFRIIEECVNNALRHGQARAIGIRLSAQSNSRTHVVTIKVTNDGLTPDGGLTEGAGLRVLRARASSFNGTVTTSIASGLFTVESVLEIRD